MIKILEQSELDEIFIRLSTKMEGTSTTAKRKAFLSIPDKSGYEKVYKPFGKQGRGFYYIKIKE